MPHKTPYKSKKDTPAKQYERFLEAAKEAEASNDAKDFERALQKVTLKRGNSQSKE